MNKCCNSNEKSDLTPKKEYYKEKFKKKIYSWDQIFVGGCDSNEQVL